MRHLLFIVFFSWSNLLLAQIPNAGFELWTSTFFYEDPATYSTNNLDALLAGSPLPVLQVDGENDGAVRLISYNDRGLLVNGFASNGDIVDLSGGVPFQGTPDSVIIDYRASLNPGDTAAIGLFFKSQGVVVGQSFIGISSSKADYQPVSFALPSMTQEPDSILIILVASVVDTPGAYSTMDIDEIRFDNGYQIENGDFNDWEAAIDEEPDGWTTRNLLNSIVKDPLFVSQTDDSYSGSLALKLSTEEYSDFQTDPGAVSGVLISAPEGPRRSFLSIDFKPTKLTGHYKYESIEADSAMAVALFYQYDPSGDSLILFGPYLEYLELSDEYIPFDFEFDLPAQPDSFIIAFVADYEEIFGVEPDLGRTLYLDDLSFDFSTEVDITQQFDISVFPNPVLDYVNLQGLSQYDHGPVVTIYDHLGRKMFNRSMSHSRNYSQIDVRDLSAGIYFIGIEVEGSLYFKKLIKN